MMYEMRRKKPEPTILLTQGILNLSHHIGMVWEQLAFDESNWPLILLSKVSCSHTQKWKSKLAEVMAWGIEPPTFRPSDTLTTTQTEDATTSPSACCTDRCPVCIRCGPEEGGISCTNCEAHWFSFDTILLLYVKHMVIVSYFFKGNPPSPHRLLFPISSKGSFIGTFPQLGQYILQPLMDRLWTTGWNGK